MSRDQIGHGQVWAMRGWGAGNSGKKEVEVLVVQDGWGLRGGRRVTPKSLAGGTRG